MLEAVLFDWGDTLIEFAYTPELVAAGHRAGLAAIGRGDLPELTEHFREEYEPLFWAPGVIEEHLVSLHLKRNVMVKSAHFSLIPLMVAQSLLVLTTGRLFCSRYVDNLPVRIVRCPVPFPPLTYYQLWHDLTHASASGRWLREQVRDVAGKLGSHGMLQRGRSARSGDAAAAN